ncbi:AraC family transcriptional regulator [Paenibacillus contaminans]|uniref:AraC family transcriptional regulator n=1 Tax=Paenibacillus contaminans TaxID=450362 RepID=UPI00131400CE|nr:AraC family transcriptional regulator [Paenibacillus contaminans]
MTIYPEYQDLLTALDIKKDQLPFYIGIHTIEKTALHHHDFVELSYIFEGSGFETINGRSYALRPGTVSFLQTHHMHRIECEPGKTLRKFCCMFDINMLIGSPFDHEWYRPLFRSGSELQPIFMLSEADARRMSAICEDLLTEYESEARLGRNSLLCAKLVEALLLFVRNGIAEREQDASVRSGTEPNAAIWPILQHVHTHYTGKLTLDDLSKKFRLSVPHISRSFKEHIGKSFLDYVHELRVESAASLLISTDMSITDVAVEAGFESFRTFSRVFRESKGMTPSEYRTAAKNRAAAVHS